ncbi:hypothetical protein VTN31DRAFT_1904 [Thermomyces dupontii]|uniref:uncharacterized protein n=1 Tax=Talaromyces thermophilus TaxID=28565 RepID=UPI003741F24A
MHRSTADKKKRDQQPHMALRSSARFVSSPPITHNTGGSSTFRLLHSFYLHPGSQHERTQLTANPPDIEITRHGRYRARPNEAPKPLSEDRERLGNGRGHSAKRMSETAPVASNQRGRGC